MRFFVLLLFFTHLLYGFDSCYSIELFQKKDTPKNQQLLEKKHFPKSCSIHHENNFLSIRCGCIKDKTKANSLLKTVQKKYKKATLIAPHNQKLNKITNKKEESKKQTINYDTSKTCYSVQLFSTKYSKENFARLSKIKATPECQLFKIGNYSTLRCGCYNSKTQAQNKLRILKHKNKDATVVQTAKYRFQQLSLNTQDNTEEKLLLLPVKKENKKKTKKKKKKDF